MTDPVSQTVTEHRIVATPRLAARRARELANIHDSVCWAKRQHMVCSTCHDLNARAARLERQP